MKIVGIIEDNIGSLNIITPNLWQIAKKYRHYS